MHQTTLCLLTYLLGGSSMYLHCILHLDGIGMKEQAKRTTTVKSSHLPTNETTEFIGPGMWRLLNTIIQIHFMYQQTGSYPEKMPKKVFVCRIIHCQSFSRILFSSEWFFGKHDGCHFVCAFFHGTLWQEVFVISFHFISDGVLLFGISAFCFLSSVCIPIERCLCFRPVPINRGPSRLR